MRPNTLITITQQPNDVYPSGRDKIYILDFVISGEINTSWQNLTDTAKIKIPRNAYVEDGAGNTFNLGSSTTGRPGPNIYGSTTTPPVVMRGDKIEIELGYFYDNMDGTAETLIMEHVFSGYITKIKNKAPIELQCEDEMWKLKQIKCPNKFFPGSKYTVQKMLTELLDGKYKVVDGVNGNIQTNIGDFRTQNETVAQVLERLRNDGGLYSFFRLTKQIDGNYINELRCSGIAYYPQDRNTEIFNFQNGNPGEGIIISDQLEYTRKEDLSIAVKAHATFLADGSGTNNDGSPKTKRKRVEVMVGKNGIIRKEDEKTFHGDIITIPVLIPNKIETLNLSDAQIKITEEQYVAQKALEYLPKYYYTGFRGGFITFGQPMVRHGDAAQLINKVITEQSGTYLIKQVITTFGTSGLRQKPLLHLRIDQGYTVQQINAGL